MKTSYNTKDLADKFLGMNYTNGGNQETDIGTKSIGCKVQKKFFSEFNWKEGRKEV